VWPAGAGRGRRGSAHASSKSSSFSFAAAVSSSSSSSSSSSASSSSDQFARPSARVFARHPATPNNSSAYLVQPHAAAFNNPAPSSTISPLLWLPQGFDLEAAIREQFDKRLAARPQVQNIDSLFEHFKIFLLNATAGNIITPPPAIAQDRVVYALNFLSFMANIFLDNQG
jgi:hypothetical protein